MYIKKQSVSLWFPDFSTLENLMKPRIKGDIFHPAFYDIETTGLSRSSSFVYLIGAAVFENGTYNIYQWFAQCEEDEALLLREFSHFLSSYTCTIQYNGCQFDQPFLEERFRLHKMGSPFQGKEPLDLYRILKPLKHLLKLTNMKQTELESFLGLPDRNASDGKECIRLYRKYLKSHKEEYAREVLTHNREDLQGLGRIISMLQYLQLAEGSYTPLDACYDGEHLLITLNLNAPLPAPFSNGNTSFYITGEKERVKLAIKTSSGQLRQYYKNFKDYDYIPSEDFAMPKSLSSCLDKSLRQPARPDTCYTWFDCSGAFLQNPKQQLQYLTHSLPYLLGTLS